MYTVASIPRPPRAWWAIAILVVAMGLSVQRVAKEQGIFRRSVSAAVCSKPSTAFVILRGYSMPPADWPAYAADRTVESWRWFGLREGLAAAFAGLASRRPSRWVNRGAMAAGIAILVHLLATAPGDLLTICQLCNWD